MLQRVRFVIEIDPRMNEQNVRESEHITNTAGMQKALQVPGRILEMLYYGKFYECLCGSQFDKQRKEWGDYLVNYTAESDSLRRMFEKSSIVSFKISRFHFDTSYVGLKIVFRRNREELGYIEMAFRPDGSIGSNVGSIG